MFPTAASAQTSFASSSTILFPVVAQTASFTGQITLFNPNASAITVNIDYFDAQNTGTPGAKTCADVVVPANRSAQFALGTQCTLAPGNHFGSLFASAADTISQFYGYSRTENTIGTGFSIEGFPLGNWSGHTAHATGLKSGFTGPTFQTNCFAGSLADPVDYTLALFDDSTGTQVGSTIAGSLGAFEQFRYLDVFTAVGAPPGDYSNVRAQFTRTSGGNERLVGFCTVQDNTSFGADFRVAKGPTPMLQANWSGPIAPVTGNLLTYVFVGPTTTIEVLSPSVVSANGASVLGVSVTPLSVLASVCYQKLAGPGPVTPLGVPVALMAGVTPTSYGASGSATLTAGSYVIGFCEINVDVGSLDNNGPTSGLVSIVPL